ncbi:MAG: CPBP family intramembrane metalloprotease [Balneolaceae bacterium]|nr:CPBP family intramembrane metalloprotease [Balneolaceae bacterium]MBO6547801.1 CPBP family intramembrane metalloprotease [Balneolaceae bacterium]MBO6648312.1 CPBP family intramembrane metalloprotease [Balneolaceae bacterium]
MSHKKASKARKTLLFVGTILLGFILFILPNLFFGITKINGGLSGINLFYIALFQVVSVSALISFSLKKRGWNWHHIGWRKPSINHIVLGIIAGSTWLVIQFYWLIPNTGGASRPDVIQMVSLMDNSIITMLSYLSLGIIGGGITEEIFNRGYFIRGMEDLFSNKKIGVVSAAIMSILFFVLGHLPYDLISTVDILVPTVIYTALFLATGSLVPSIVAHGLYNGIAIILVYLNYFQG